MSRKFRGATAVVGIGQTPWYPRGGSPFSEKKLALQAIVAAAEDAGIDPRDIDGFVSYAGERSSGPRLMAALGTRELLYSAQVWTHGGGIPGAVGLAASGIVSGRAEIVVVVRAMAEKQGERRLASMSRPIEAGRTGRGAHGVSSQDMVNGVDERLTSFAMSATRLMEADGVPREALRALSLASYYHGQRNPRAYAQTTALDAEAYEASRWVAEPLHVFDFSRQNDAGAAVILVAAERAKEYKLKPAYVLSAPMGRFGGEGYGYHGRTPEGRTTAGFQSVARRLWAESGYGPSDVDVAQVYTNSTAAAVNTILDHGFCSWENVGEFMQFENLIAPDGGFPVNTAGGDLADGFLHGMSNVPEAVRQIRGTSPNQVPGAKLSFMSGGPNDVMVSSMLLGSEETL